MDGSPLPPWLGSRWVLALALCLLAALLLLGWPQIAHGQENSPPTAIESSPDLRQLTLIAETLLMRLQERRAQVESLQADLREARRLGQLSSDQLTALERQLTEARLQQESLHAALTETSTSLDSLWQDYDRLSAAYQAYREEAEKQIAEARAQRDGWRLGAVVAGICAAVLAVVAALR